MPLNVLAEYVDRQRLDQRTIYLLRLSQRKFGLLAFDGVSNGAFEDRRRHSIFDQHILRAGPQRAHRSFVVIPADQHQHWRARSHRLQVAQPVNAVPVGQNPIEQNHIRRRLGQITFSGLDAGHMRHSHPAPRGLRKQIAQPPRFRRVVLHEQHRKLGVQHVENRRVRSDGPIWFSVRNRNQHQRAMLKRQAA